MLEEFALVFLLDGDAPVLKYGRKLVSFLEEPIDVVRWNSTIQVRGHLANLPHILDGLLHFIHIHTMSILFDKRNRSLVEVVVSVWRGHFCLKFQLHFFGLLALFEAIWVVDQSAVNVWDELFRFILYNVMSANLILNLILISEPGKQLGYHENFKFFPCGHAS